MLVVLALVATPILLWLWFRFLHAWHFKKAIERYNALAPEVRTKHIIRTDRLFPYIGPCPDPHRWHRGHYGFVAYKDPEVGMCLLPTYSELPDYGSADA